jgi:hypothetical protein
MMKRVGKEQSGAIALEMRREAAQSKIKARKNKILKYRITCWSITTFVIFYFVWLAWAIVQIRITERPELGRCLIPKGTWGYKQYSNLKWVDCNIDKRK